MTHDLPRYLLSVRRDSSIVYRYNPPADAIASNIVQRTTCGTDYTTAVAYANAHNEVLDNWRKEHRYLKHLSEKSTVDSLVKSYLLSVGYAALADKTKQDYVYYINCWLSDISKTRLADMSTPTCQRLYDKHASHSVSLSNHSLSVYRLLFSYAIRNGFTKHNPFTNVKRLSDKPRRVVWEKKHIKQFMDTAFSKYEWRNVGFIVYMAYSWGQRLGDMRTLTWDDYSVSTGILKLEQSKRRARVTIPTSKDLQAMLKEQHETNGWQKYIVPSEVPDGRGGFKPFSLLGLAKLGNTIMKASKVPSGLRMMDLRRTAVTEMIEAGVPLPNVMAVTGHATPHSLTPYIKNTLKSATVAQDMRGML